VSNSYEKRWDDSESTGKDREGWLERNAVEGRVKVSEEKREKHKLKKEINPDEE
jgi:hypothetical protein